METIQLNHITFAVPARQFVVNASVTVNESLPKVTEFVLRLIRICGEISAEEIEHYFGFSGKETRLLLESLRDQSLIRMHGELIQLSEYAETKFYTDDDLPRFSVVEPRIDIVDFDLMTFHPVDGRNRQKAPSFTAELTVDDERISSSTRHAEQAYQRHFQRILRLRERGKDKIDIYKISSIQSKRLFDLPIDVSFSLDGHGEVERLINYDEEAPEEFRLGIEAAVSDALKSPLSAQTGWLKEFIERFDDKVLDQFFSKKGFDFERYVREVFIEQKISYSGNTKGLLGNLYMPENKKVVTDWIKSALQHNDSNFPSNFLTSAAWLAPEYKFWGRTALLDEFYFSVQDALPQVKNADKPALENLHLLYPGTKETAWGLQQQLWSKREKSVHFYSGDIMGGRVEVLFVPTKMAVVLFHFAPHGNSSALVPFGFITKAPELIKEAQVVIMETMARGKGYVCKAAFNRDSVSPSNSFEDYFGFINYCGA